MSLEIQVREGHTAYVIDPPEEMIGTLYKPDTAKGENHLATVVACDTADNLFVGDRIVVPAYAGIPVQVQGREIYFIKSKDILARLVEAADGCHR